MLFGSSTGGIPGYAASATGGAALAAALTLELEAEVAVDGASSACTDETESCCRTLGHSALAVTPMATAAAMMTTRRHRRASTAVSVMAADSYPISSMLTSW